MERITRARVLLEVRTPPIPPPHGTPLSSYRSLHADSKDEDGSENLDMNDYGLPMDDDDDDDDAYRGVEEAVAGVALFNEAGKRVRGRPKGTKVCCWQFVVVSSPR
jgi:hypothetical protein